MKKIIVLLALAAMQTSLAEHGRCIWTKNHKPFACMDFMHPHKMLVLLPNKKPYWENLSKKMDWGHVSTRAGCEYFHAYWQGG